MYDSYYDISTILKKINTTRSSTVNEDALLASLMPSSFAEIWDRYQDVLFWGEARFLDQAVRDAQKKNTEAEARVFSRANPQLARAVRLGINQSSHLRDYNSWFGNRAQQYVTPGSVASMFSPAGYLTELYREARDLHTTDNVRRLDTRRPDLTRLALSQDNMDAEVSTLSIANDIVLSTIVSREGTDSDAVMEKLSTWRLSGVTPYHLPYESARQAILLQDPMLDALAASPAVAQQVDLSSLLAIMADVSPELYRILTEEISAGTAAALYEKNFGSTPIDNLTNAWPLGGYYDADPEKLLVLTSLLTNHDFSEPVQYYTNNMLTTLVARDDTSVGQVVQIVRSGLHSTLSYMELLPQGGDSYLLNFNFRSVWTQAEKLYIGTQGGDSSDLYSGTLQPQSNEHISIPVTIPPEKLAAGVTIGISRVRTDTGSYYYATATFRLYTLSAEQYLLYLNKIIRLYKACRFTPEQMYLLIYNNPGDEPFDTGMLGLSFLSYYYLKRYGLRLEDALVLAGGRISAVGVKGQASWFTTLFNTPLLGNRSFSADGAAVDWDSQDADHQFRASVIKRGFHVSGTDLKTLWQLAAGEGVSFSTTAENLALLYRVHLLADVHHLTATELSLLLSVSPWGQTAVSALDESGFAALVNFVHSTTRWLTQLGWTVSELYLMVTARRSTVLTPEISSLIAAVRGAVASADAEVAELIRALAPVAAATGQLAGRAESVLRWLEQQKPGGTDVKTFVALALKDDRSEAETAQLVAFCQALGQLVLLVRKTNVSDYLLAMLIDAPSRFADGVSVIPLDIESLRLLGRTNRRILQTGDYAQTLLAALAAGTLTTDLLAQALGVTPQAAAQALALADSGAGGIIRSLQTLDVTLQWLDFATALNCTPSTAAALVALKYTNISDDSAPSYAAWQAVSDQLQAGLSAEQTVRLRQQLEELTSAALSNYHIQTAAIAGVDNREQLYAWLLIDGQVSSQVTTTRVAEATASIQLYVNRCRNGLEAEVQQAVLTRQFFTDWERYNRRYSTWAGVSQLVYYPENYIDPTVRTGQTSMMDNLLGTIGQSELSADTVGDAFKGYMTQFEKIANLDIVSAYHDNASLEEGKTWFIGKSTDEGEKYYWRSLQQGMLTNGKYPATAWSEWLEIGTGIAAYNNMVRPVIFSDRLYVVWVTERPVATDNSGTVSESKDYFLSFSYLRHDGTWSGPLFGKLSDYLPAGDVSALASKHLFCTNSNDNSPEIMVLFYTPAASEADNLNVAVSGLTISVEHEMATLNNAKNYRVYIWQQFDTQSERRINMLLVQAVTYTADPLEYSWGYEYLSIMNGNYKVAGVFLNVDTQEVAVYYDVNVRYIFNGFNSGSFGYNRRNWIDYIKTLQGVGHTYAFYKTPFTFANRMEPGEGFVVIEGVHGIESDHTNGVRGLIKMSRDLVEPMVYFSQDHKINTYVRNAPANYSYYWNEWSFSTLEYQLPESGWLYSYEEAFVVYQQHFSGKINYSTKVNPQDVGYTISWKGKSFYEAGNAGMTTPDWDTTYSFKGKFFTFPVSDFVNGKVEFTVNLWAQNTFAQSLGAQHATLTVYQQVDSRKMSLMRTDTNVQYLQRGPYRVRINTLFARQLVARANLGLDAVLSMETQLLQEPQLGPGNYITVTFDKYTQALHGDGWYELYLVGVTTSSDDNTLRDRSIIASGYVSSAENTTVRVFLPHNNDKTGSEDFSGIAVKYSDYDGSGSYKTFEKYDWHSSGTYQKDTDSKSRGMTSLLLSDETEPMDFTGANALYFWEMFLYVPAMVCQRLLQESKFDEATTWMKYIWNPAGYYSSNGTPAPWTWNVRPLEEDTSWNPNPLDSVDPDAVAQSDPMHYKVATFMRALDLLIARGDAAYRLLERDTLNEAKMWYTQALNLLGDEPYDALVQGQGNWSSPVLGSAASQTLAQTYHLGLLKIRTETMAVDETRTANSLLGLFYPQFNSKLSGYWQTLRQRLYNLRHNLSIDGQALYLPVYAAAASPAALLSAAVTAAGGGDSLPAVSLPLLRFPTLLESARGVVSQLIQFGTTLQTITERQDAEALSVLLQTQGVSLLDQSIQVQEHMLAELDADQAALQVSRRGAEQRRDSYRQLYDENVNAGETQAMNLLMASSVTAEAATALHMVAAGLDMVPNIYGLADGGMRYGALLSAAGMGVQIAADVERIAGDKIAQSEMYRRRRQEWGIQRNNAEAEITLIDAQLASLDVRRKGVALQKAVVETQLAQTQAQLDYLQGKFSGPALYSWLRGTLSTIYYQFYDAALTRCLLAQRAWQLHFDDEATTFIRPGAWQGNWLGFMAGETLMLGLERMSQAWIEQDARVLEVNKTVSLAKFYSSLPSGEFSLAEQAAALASSGSGSAGSGGNTLSVGEGQLKASVKLADLKIAGNYPAELGARRRIKQISVTLPLLIGPYQNIHAVLSYGGSVVLPQGCNVQAVSHGMNDSGQFQLDFNDGRWLPFEGIPVDDSGTLTLSFPDVTGEQKDLLLSLKEIILHIRYTITG
ncbi:neuraminidase-like domain-containing protein [Kosakonia sacchari]|uniref:Neuraminidase-like domain-containing protein n=1 Tax=Kosakonia sacchari TaxID=1158459 RepID=A0ABZ0MQ41_9ENTR|nr:neuraminidase-like domain-containing protein [Kosakonia sacchari]WOZ77178.1 neuraminidase-like domain-containing protein [Kosakonia sacchari]